MIETVAAAVILVATCIAAAYAMFRGHQRTPANPVRCEYCGVLHGNHAINCYRPEVPDDHTVARVGWMITNPVSGNVDVTDENWVWALLFALAIMVVVFALIPH